MLEMVDLFALSPAFMLGIEEPSGRQVSSYVEL